MTPHDLAEYRRIASSEADLSREYVAALAILKLCDEVERLQDKLERLRAVKQPYPRRPELRDGLDQW